MENQEEWRDVVGYEGLYRVSSMGRVFSNYTKKLLKPSLSEGYPHVVLYKDKIGKSVKVHILMGKAFIDANYFEKGLVIDHKDNVRSNCILSNLRLITFRDNTDMQHLPSTSKYVGVRIYGKKWRSSITFNGKKLDLGSFDDELDAHYAYQDALICINECRPQDIKFKRYQPKGYFFNKTSKKWRAYIWLFEKSKDLGYYDTEKEAKESFENALICIKEGRIKDIVFKRHKTKGYHFDAASKKWRVRGYVNGKRITIGNYVTEEEAIKVSSNIQISKKRG